jgi:hypothetical protein
VNDLEASFGAGIRVKSTVSGSNNLSDVIISDDAFGKTFQFTYGSSGAGLINQAYIAVRDLAAVTAETLNLRSGLTNRHSEAIVFATVYLVYIRLLPSDAPYTSTSLSIGGTNGATVSDILPIFDDDADTETIGRNDVFSRLRNAGVTVDNTNKNLVIENNHATLSARYLIVILGVNT